jgi:NarL family two-component system response regulator LiaR
VNKIRVLVADDHALFREGLSRLIDGESDLECVAMAADGNEAVELTRELLPEVVLLDISMPKMDGIEAAKQIKDSCPTIAIIILSAYKYPHYVYECLNAGLDGYLLKSTERSRLINAIRMVYAGSVVFNLEALAQIRHTPSTSRYSGKVSSMGLDSLDIQILKLAAEGMSNQKIAQELNISENTIGSHLVKAFRKLGVQSRTEAVMSVLKEGYFTIENLIGNDKTDNHQSD